jgi:ATP-dependent Clp protease protease subunit
MNILQKSSGGLFLVPIETRLLSDRIFLLEGMLDCENANELCMALLYLKKEDPKAPITILINSEGGEISAGFLIIDAIRSCAVPVRTICIARAFSMAALILASGTLSRNILPHGKVLIHEPRLGEQISGTSSSMKVVSDTLLAVKKKVNQILSELTGQSEEVIDEATCYDHFMDPDEAKSFGLVDQIITFDQILEEKNG